MGHQPVTVENVRDDEQAGAEGQELVDGAAAGLPPVQGQREQGPEKGQVRHGVGRRQDEGEVLRGSRKDGGPHEDDADGESRREGHEGHVQHQLDAFGPLEGDPGKAEDSQEEERVEGEVGRVEGQGVRGDGQREAEDHRERVAAGVGEVPQGDEAPGGGAAPALGPDASGGQGHAEDGDQIDGQFCDVEDPGEPGHVVVHGQENGEAEGQEDGPGQSGPPEGGLGGGFAAGGRIHGGASARWPYRSTEAASATAGGIDARRPRACAKVFPSLPR